MFHILTIRVDIPALDRITDYLEGKQQAQIDALVQQVAQLTQQLAQHAGNLQAAMDKT